MQHDSMNGTPGSDPGGLDFLDFPSSPGSQPRSAPHHGLPEGDTPPSHPKATPGVTANSTLDHAIHKLASDDFTRLLHFEAMCETDGDLDDLSRVFQGNEGAELLDPGFFNDLMSPEDPAHGTPARNGHPGHAQPHPVHRRPAGAEAAAARSVLASLGEDDSPGSMRGETSHHQADFRGSMGMHHAPQQAGPAPASHTSEAYPASPPPSTPQRGPPAPQDPPPAGGVWLLDAQASPSPGSVPMTPMHLYPFQLQPGAMFVDPGTGQALPMQWGVHGAGAAPGPQLVALPGAGGVPGYYPGHPPAGMQLAYMPGQYPYTPPPMHHVVHGMPGSGAGTPSPSRKGPKRRRPSRGSAGTPAETPGQRSARLAQGFTYDPATGAMLQHGPALLAAARHDKPVPLVGALFEAHAASPFGAGPAPVEYTIMAQHSARSVADALAAGGGARGDEARGGGAAPATPRAAVPGFPMAEASPRAGAGSTPRPAGGAPAAAAAGEAGGPTLPSGRHLRGQSAHGLLTALVTQDLMSTPPEPAAPVGPEVGGAEGGQAGGTMRGVSREKWSLFWDAYVDRRESSTMLDGFKQEAVWLGRYPTVESAARAHDIAAIKLHGPAAATNYEPETYSRVLPTLSSHSEDQVVGALRKDSALAVQRTSRFRGVRRVGARAFDARLEDALGGDGSGLNTSPSSHTSMFVPDLSSS
uniref:AP2/ERF domain-containing protein n=1 Tax=Auxenochlorella protothecoides TaxID=3075 RepID=A0A1D2AGZ2_AUXPR